MPDRVEITVSLFGAFRTYTHGDAVHLQVPRGSTLGDLRLHLEKELMCLYPDFNHRGLIAESAFADEKSILDDATVIQPDSTLAVLPPVCGG